MKRLSNSAGRLKALGLLRNDKRIITKFADMFGLVHFGFVSQHDDEHRIVRGMTLSTNHRDEHYCIGTYENYDVIYVKRTDTLHTKTNKRTTHTWHIMAFDLKTSRELPHFFVGFHDQSEEFYMRCFARFPAMRHLKLGHLSAYPPTFDVQYRLFANPATSLEIEQIITPAIAATITTHFKGLSFEVTENTLLVYSEHSRITMDLLETILKNGRWLAEALDHSATVSFADSAKDD